MNRFAQRFVTRINLFSDAGFYSKELHSSKVFMNLIEIDMENVRLRMGKRKIDREGKRESSR